jgi:hypothetical protein
MIEKPSAAPVASQRRLNDPTERIISAAATRFSTSNNAH